MPKDLLAGVEVTNEPKDLLAKDLLPEETKSMSWKETIGKGVTKIPGGLYEYGKSAVHSVTHPQEVGEALARISMGAFGKEEYKSYWEAFKKHYGDKYGSVEGFKKALSENPVDVGADVATLASAGGGMIGTTGKLAGLSKTAKVGETLTSIGKAVEPINVAAKVASVPVKVAARTLGEGIGLTTGSGFGSIKKVVEASAQGGPEAKAMTNALRGHVEGEGIFNKAMDALYEMKDEMGATYRGHKVNIDAITTPLDMTSLKKEFADVLKEFKIKPQVSSKGKLTFNFEDSKVDRSARGAMEELLRDVAAWDTRPGNTTPSGLDTLKQRLDDFYSPTSKNSNVIVQRLRDRTRNIIVKAVPEYDVMTKEYSQTIKTINEIRDTLSLKENKASADVAIKKLTGALRENNEYRQKMVQKLEEFDPTLTSEIAGLAMSPVLPRGLYGRVISGMEALAGLSTHSGKFFAALLAGSPRVTGEFLNVLGKSIMAERKIHPYIPPAEARVGTYQAEKAYGITGSQSNPTENP